MIEQDGMLFPESARLIFTLNPLQEVVCQLRFPTILEIKASEPASFQKTMRPGYPLYNRGEALGLLTGLPAGIPKDITDVLARLPIAQRGEDVVHKFITENSARTISLAPEFLAVTETEYGRWEHFRSEIELAKAALEQEYEPAFYSRIGLRYIDIIDREELGLAGTPWDALIEPFVIGMLGATGVGPKVQEIGSVVLVELGDDVVPGGQVRVRHGLVGAENAHDVYRVDVDLFTSERSDAKDVLGILDVFNKIAGNLFRWTITDTLRQALRPTEPS